MATLQDKIEDVLNRSVRPQLKQHGGNVSLVDVHGRTAKVRLLGRCSSCPSAFITTEQLIEKELTDAIPEIDAVVLVQPVSDELLEMAKSILRRDLP